MADTATIEALLSLPVDERAEIAELLLESLNPPAAVCLNDSLLH